MMSENQTISVNTASKLIGCNPRHVCEGIENGSFPFGFRFYTESMKAVYKISKKPFLEMLGVDCNELLNPNNQTIDARRAAELIGCKEDTVRHGIKNETFPCGFYFMTKAGSKVYRVAKNPFCKMLDNGQYKEVG